MNRIYVGPICGYLGSLDATCGVYERFKGSRFCNSRGPVRPETQMEKNTEHEKEAWFKLSF